MSWRIWRRADYPKQSDEYILWDIIVAHVQAEAKLRAQKVVVEATKVPLLIFSHFNLA